MMQQRRTVYSGDVIDDLKSTHSLQKRDAWETYIAAFLKDPHLPFYECKITEARTELDSYVFVLSGLEIGESTLFTIVSSKIPGAQLMYGTKVFPRSSGCPEKRGCWWIEVSVFRDLPMEREPFLARSRRGELYLISLCICVALACLVACFMLPKWVNSDGIRAFKKYQ